MAVVPSCRNVRFLASTILLLAVSFAAGCGSDDVDFSKPTGPLAAGGPKPSTDKPPADPVPEAKPSEPKADAPKETKKADQEQVARPRPEDQPTASVEAAPTDPPPARKTIEFELSWLTDRDQVTSFSDDGSLVAVGSGDGRLRMFDVGAGAVRDVFRTENQQISQVVVAPDNQTMAGITADGHLRLHTSGTAQGFDRYQQSRLRNSAQQRGLGTHSSPIISSAWHPNGRILATAAADSSIHLWDVPLKDAVELATNSESLAAIAVNKENDVIVTVSQSGHVQLLDFAERSVLNEFTIENAGTITRAAFVAESDLVLIGTKEGSILAYSSVRGEEVARLQGHQGELTCLTVAADSRSFLSADSVGQLRLWRLPLNASGQLATFDAEVDVLRVTDDRRHAAAFIRGKGLSLVRLTTPPVARPVSGRSDDINHITFTQIGSVLVGATKTGVVRFWSVPEGELIAESAVHRGEIHGIVAHPRDQTIATAGEDGRIRLLEVPSRLPKIRNAGSALAKLSTSKDGLLLAGQNPDGQISLWQMANGAQIGQLGGLKGKATAFTAGSKWIAIGDESGSIRFLTTASIRPDGDVRPGSAAIRSLALAEQTGVAYSLDADGTVRELTLPPGGSDSIKLKSPGTTALLSLNNGRQAVVASSDRSLKRLHLTKENAKEELIGTLQSPARIIAATDDASLVVTGNSDGSVEFHAADQSASRRFEADGSVAVNSVAINSQGQRALTAHSDGTVREWNLAALSKPQIRSDVSDAQLVSVSPDGKLVAVTTGQKTVVILQTTDGAVVQQHPAFESELTAVSWELDGRYIIAADQNGRVRRSEASTGKEVAGWDAGAPITSMAPVPGGNGFLVGFESGMIQYWTTDTGPGDEIRPADNQAVEQLVVDSETDVLVLAGGKAEQWDIQKGSKARSLDATNVSCIAVAINSNNQLLGTDDGQVHVIGSGEDSAKPITGGTAPGEIQLIGTTEHGSSFSLSASGQITVWNNDSLVPTHWNSGTKLRAAATNLTGTTIAVVTQDGNLQLLQLPQVRTYRTSSPNCLAAQFDAAADSFLTIGNDGQRARWSQGTQTDDGSRQLKLPANISGLAASSDGSTIAGLAGTQVFFWQTTDEADQAAVSVTLPSDGRWLRLSSTGNRLVVGLDNGQAWLIDAENGSVVEQITLPVGSEQTADLTADGFGLIAGGTSSQLSVYQPSVRRVLTTDADTDAAISFNAETKQLSVVALDGSVRVWESDAEPVIDRPASDAKAARQQVLSGNGEWVAQVFDDNSVATRRIRDGLEPNVFTTESAVRSIAISYDGQLIALSTDDGSKVVDRAGNPVQLIDQQGTTDAVTFVGRQSTIAVGDSDGSISFSAYSRSSRELEVGVPVSGVAFSSTGSQIASWDEEKVRIWNPETKEELVQFDDAADGLVHAAFADGDRLLVGAGTKGRIFVWSLDQRKLRNDFAGPAGGQRFAVAGNGNAIAVATDVGQLVVHSISNGEVLETYDTAGNGALSLALRSDDLAVFAGRKNGEITEHCLNAVTSIAAHKSQAVADATFTGSNGFILSAAGDGTIAMHQSGGVKIRSFEGAAGRPVGIVASPDGDTVHAVSADDNGGVLTSWKLSNATLVRQTLFNLQPDFCRPTPDGGRLAAVSEDSLIQIIDTTKGVLGERVVAIGDVTDVAIASAADALVTSASDGSVRAYPFHLVADFLNAGPATSIDWSHDGRYLAAGTAGLISIWDLENGAFVAELPIEELPEAESPPPEADDTPTPEKQKISKYGTGDDDDDEPVKKKETPVKPVFDPNLPKPPATLATQVVITPRGELCASFFDGSVRVWDLTEAARAGSTPKPHTIFRHPSPAMALAIDPLGERIACGCEDSNIWLWQVDSGQELARFSGHTGAVLSLAFEATGTRLFSTGADRAAKVWPIGEGGTPSGTAAVEIAMADASAKLRAALKSQLQNAEQSEERTRLRSLIRSLENADAEDIADTAISAADSEISRLRAALRESVSEDNRDAARRELMTALKARELEELLTGASSQSERERLRQELEKMHSTGWNAHRLRTGQPVGQITELDRQFADMQFGTPDQTKLKERIQTMLRDTPIWPTTRKETWSRDETHLLAAIPTEFQFDAQLRPIRLALTPDGLTLAAARESADLRPIGEDGKVITKKQKDDDDDDDDEKKGPHVRGTVRVWDVLTGTELRAWTDVAGSRVQSVRFSGSGDTVYTAPDLFAFRLSTGESRELARNVSLSVGSDLRSAVVGLPGRPLQMSDAIRLVDLDAMQFQMVHFAAYESLVPAVALSHDGKTIVAAVRERARHRLIEFDAQTLKERAVLEEFKHREPWFKDRRAAEYGISHIVFSPDDRYVVAYGKYSDKEHRLTAIQMTSRKTSVIDSKDSMIRRDSPVPLRFTGTRNHLVIDAPDGIHVVSMDDGKNLDVVEFNSVSGGSRLVKLTSDGSVAAFADASGVVTLRKLGQDQGSVTFQAHAGPVVGMDFAQGDRMLVTAGEENQIRIWSLAGFFHSRQPATDSSRNRAGRNRR